MAMAKRAECNRRKKYAVEDDTDDEDFDPMEEFKSCKRSRRDGDFGNCEVVNPGTEEPSGENLVTAALKKCQQFRIDLRDALRMSIRPNIINSVANGVANGMTYGPPLMQLLQKADVDAACDIYEDDTDRVLKPYQIGGINFLLLLYSQRVGGAILADDMGMGKTVQAIAFLAVLKNIYGDKGPHLVVAPATVLENWEREIRKWCPSLSVILYHGTGRASEYKRLHGIAKSRRDAPFNIMLTSYSMFEKQSEQMKQDRKLFKMWKWSCVLMDEGHCLKDPTSHRTKRLHEIACTARQRVMLTGTPLQNNLSELWSILNFMMPDTFDVVGEDLEKYLSSRTCSHDQDLIQKIKVLLRPFVLRRLKENVPYPLVGDKKQEVICLSMVEDQAQTYKEAVANYRALAKANQSPKASEPDDILKCLSDQQVSNIFTHLRKISNHPLLVRKIYTDKTIKELAKKFHRQGVFGDECSVDRVQEELASFSDFEIHKLCCQYGGVRGQGKLNKSLALSSGKCRYLAKLLPELKREGHRCLIFSQWTMILDILEWVLQVLEFRFKRLDGKTPVAERQALVDEFNKNSDISVVLVSTRAGGQGINLTGADTVIIHDVGFNPQIDRQAEDRCHRIGQTKTVTVYRLVTETTVDQDILKIAKDKLTLDAAVLQSARGPESLQKELEIRSMREILSSQIRE